jgi:hypothetical protein
MSECWLLLLFAVNRQFPTTSWRVYRVHHDLVSTLGAKCLVGFKKVKNNKNESEKKAGSCKKMKPPKI